MNAAIRSVYTRCGFSKAATAAIVNKQGIDTLEEIRFLKDSEIDSLCKVVRRPGGAIAGAGVGQVVANPGIPVSLRAEKSLKLAVYWIRQQEKVTRDVTPADIVMDVFRSICEVRDTNRAYVAPTVFPVINDKDWPKTIETLTEFLDSFLGDTKIPLGYVFRKTVAFPEGDNPRPAYPTIAAEMICRATHGSTVYRSDNQKFWDIIAQITRDQECWTYVKPAQRTHNGRAAFSILYDH